MHEEHANYKWKDKARSLAYSMKLVNGVYDKLIEVFSMQIRTDIEDEYTKGWNDGFMAACEMTKACKYTKDDFLEMLEEETTEEPYMRGTKLGGE